MYLQEVRRGPGAITDVGFCSIDQPMMKPRMGFGQGIQPLWLAYEFITRSAGRPGRHQVATRSGPGVYAQPKMEDEQVVLQELPKGALQELKNSAEFIRSGSYRPSETEGYALRSENEALVERFPQVLAHFLDEPGRSETRIIAIRVETSANLPVKIGATVILIPLDTGDGTPTINEQELRFGTYAQLTGSTPMELAIEGTFYSLLLLRQTVDA